MCALIKFSALVSDMRGKLNGSVMAKNKGGNYMRNKTTPVNPQSQFQQLTRARFGGVSSGWRSLSDIEVTKWNEAAKSFPYTDIFGDSRLLNGIQLFTKLNANLKIANSPQLVDAPSPRGVVSPTITSLSAVIANTSLDIALNIPTTQEPTNIVIEATQPLPSGIRFFKNRFRFLNSYISTNTVPGTDWYDMYTNRFGLPSAGSIIAIRVSAINKATGERSVGATKYCVVQ